MVKSPHLKESVVMSESQQQWIERQLRPVGVLTESILNAFKHTPRERFVPKAERHLAYADMSLPLSHGQHMLSPSVQGQLLEAAALKASDTVLEIGTGTGYLTALLAQLCHKVVSVEIYEDLLLDAQQALVDLRCTNVQLVRDDYANRLEGQYDVIMVTGALYDIPQSFYAALRPGGRLVAIVGQASWLQAYVMEQQHGQWGSRVICPVATSYLVHAQPPAAFHF